jgi:LacI family transcriptional regulator
MHTVFVEVRAGNESVMNARGYGLLLCSSGEDPKKERSELQMLRARQVDGIILASVHASENTDLLKKLGNVGCALVMIDRDDHPGVKCHRVVTDDVEVGRLATSHLASLGRRAIAHLAGPAIAHAQRREQGYVEAMNALGREVKPDLIVRGGFMEADGYRAMRQLLGQEGKKKGKVDAVFAANDPAAIGAMKAIEEAGRRIPDDIAVVGAGAVAYGDLLRVPLTTVSWSRHDLGCTAAELLLDQMGPHPKGPFQRVVIPPRLVIRESCGGARGAS